MIDLIDESGKDLTVYGYKVKKLPKGDAELAYLNIDTLAKSKALGFDKGEYFILNVPSLHENDQAHEYLAGVLKNCLESLIKNMFLHHPKILIVGLGNPDILADCLGKAVIDEVDIYEHRNKVYKFCPNIYSITGIETFDFVKYVRDGLKADLVIVIDSLATKEISRLATSLQITNVGIAPGSGVGRENKKICEDEIGVPCIAIGVPLMYCHPEMNLLLTPKDIHENVYTVALIIASALKQVIKKVN